MKTTFIHTADWQLGKPFAGVEDDNNRILLQQERINVLGRIAEVARETGAQFIVVAGDVFDSPTPTNKTISAACSAIGEMKVPVYAIPGNHDHGGPGSVWEQEFFKHEHEQLAPNLHVLLKPEPVSLEQAVLFPCPLLRRHEASDPTAWLRSPELDLSRLGDKPRVVIAHGTVQGFSGEDPDEDEAGGDLPNLINLEKLTASEFDYMALGDWHGAKQVLPTAWYSGTPEMDRFPKGGDHDQGKVVLVTVRHGGQPEAQLRLTARFGWHELPFQFADDSAVAQLEEQVTALIAGRAGQDLVRLRLSGALGIEASDNLHRKLEVWQARLLRLKLTDETTIAPSPSEAAALRERPADPLISRVSSKLLGLAAGTGEEAAVARVALRELYAACNRG